MARPNFETMILSFQDGRSNHLTTGTDSFSKQAKHGRHSRLPLTIIKQVNLSVFDKTSNHRYCILPERHTLNRGEKRHCHKFPGKLHLR